MGGIAWDPSFVWAVLAGVAPALVWLWFFHKEDRHPEPVSLIALAFVAGAASVFPAVLLERAVLPFTATAQTFLTAATLLAWAIIEEFLKWFFVWALVLWRKAIDEPIDIPLYLLTAALGFAAVENVLFLAGPFAQGLQALGVMQGGMRFVGATLLHVAASGSLGVALALVARKPRPYRRLGLWVGMGFAIVVHFAFNLALLRLEALPPVAIFLAVWALVIGLLAALEYVKRSPVVNRPWHTLRRKPVVY